MDWGTSMITIKLMFKSKHRKQNHRPLLHRGLHIFSLYERALTILHAPTALQRAGANRDVIPHGGGESRRSVRLGLQLEFLLQAALLRTEIRLRTSPRFFNQIAYLRVRQVQALRGDCLVMVTRIKMSVVSKAATPNKITTTTRMSLVNKAGTSISITTMVKITSAAHKAGTLEKTTTATMGIVTSMDTVKVQALPSLGRGHMREISHKEGYHGHGFHRIRTNQKETIVFS
ncbi:hypothetical protein BKA80DRAFT_269580 [Phyllosticta citrichinensis]